MKTKSSMRLDILILGCLAFEDASGYELMKQINCPVKAFWHTDHPQIYLTLKELLKKDLIEVADTAPGRNLDKKFYRITESGRTELENFLRDSPQDLTFSRNPVLVHLFMLGNLPAAEQLVLFKHYYEFFKKQEAAASAKYSDFSKKKPSVQNKKAYRLHEAARRVYQFSVMRRQMILTWLDACISDLEKEAGIESLGSGS